MRAVAFLFVVVGLTASHATPLAPLRLRGGMTFQQGVLACTGSVVTLSGVATVLDPVSTLQAEADVKQDTVVSKLFGLALLGWGVGKLCVRRGYESRHVALPLSLCDHPLTHPMPPSRFCQLNVLPMVGSLFVSGKRFGGLPFMFHALTVRPTPLTCAASLLV
jgi:hypothetical protein